MKKLLLLAVVVALFCAVGSVQAQNDDVDIRLDLVSNTFNTPSPGQGTMVIDLQLKSTLGNCTITTVQNDVALNAALNTAYVSHSFAPSPLSGSHTDNRITFNFLAVNYSANNSTWTTFTTLTIVYNMGAGLGTVDWVAGVAYNLAGTRDIDGTTPAQEGAEIPLDGDTDNPPEDLPLPVELVSFAAGQTQDGIRLSWKTQSETDLVGFHVLRSSSKDGKFEPISNLIASKGNSTSPAEYTFVDANVDKNYDYYYKLEEVTAFGDHIVIGDAEVLAATLPTSIVLYQNYPNPFNPTTEIRFDLPSDQQVSLVVYNLLGKEVRTLVDGNVAGGVKTVKWDGLDNNGQELSSGIYFYKLTANGYTSTNKMTKLD